MIGFEINNLEHRKDRKDICIGNFITQGVPYEVVTFHEAIWGGDYPDAKAVCDAAVADGYPEFSEGCEMGGRGDAAAHWGMMRIFDKIASDDYPYLLGYFNQDDRLLPSSMSYNKLLEISLALEKSDPNFLYLQLCWHASDFSEDVKSVEVRSDSFLTIQGERIYKGIFSYGDSGLVMSQAGAKYIRKRFAATKNWLEALILEEGNVAGTYSLWNPFNLMIEHQWCGYSNIEDAQDRIVVNAGRERTIEKKEQVAHQAATEHKMETPVSDNLKLSFGKIGASKSSDSSFNIKTGQKFYIDALPRSASMIDWVQFNALPDLEQNIYLVDDRWEDLSNDTPSWVTEITEVCDIQHNRQQSQYEWVCGFSAFFLKESYNPEPEHKHRTESATHDKLIRGIRELIEFPEKCPATLLRFYVSEEVFDRLHRERLINAPDTEFYKMRYPSETSNIGAVWRMMCLSDAEFEYAIETDCAPYEDRETWIYERIKEGSRPFFKNWLSGHEYEYAGEFLIFPHNWDPKQGELVLGNMENFDFISGGGIVSYPERMVDVRDIISRHISERLNPMIFYHEASDKYAVVNYRTSCVPHGWEGFGADQEMWRYIKKLKPVRHLIHSQSTDHIKDILLPENHFMKRIISQLTAAGSEFVDIDTLEPVFAFD